MTMPYIYYIMYITYFIQTVLIEIIQDLCEVEMSSVHISL